MQASDNLNLENIFLNTRPKPSPGIDLERIYMESSPALAKKKNTERNIPREKPKMGFMPTKEDIPGILSAIPNALTFGATNVGNESIQKTVSGYPGEYFDKGLQMAKNVPSAVKEFGKGGLFAAGDAITSGVYQPTLHENYGVPVLPKPKTLGGNVIATGLELATNAAAGRFGANALKNIGEKASKSGVEMTKKIIHPTGYYAKGSNPERIAKAALDERVLSANPSRVAEKAQSKINTLMDEIDDIAANYSGGGITAKTATRRAEALARGYESVGDYDRAAKIRSTVKDIIKSQGFTEPVYNDVEKSQFVLKGASKQVTPELKRVKASELPRKKTGMKPSQVQGAGLDQRGKRLVTKSTDVNSPESFVAMRRGKGKAAIVQPKEKYSIRPEVKGISKTERVKVGERFKENAVPETLRKRRAIDAHLKSIKKEGGFQSDTNSPEISARQEFAGGLRREIGKKVPEIGERNQRVKNLIDLVNVSAKRGNIKSRHNLMDLYTNVAAMGSVVNQKLLLYLLPKMVYGAGKGKLAQGLYDFGNAAQTSNLPQSIKNANYLRILEGQMN